MPANEYGALRQRIIAAIWERLDPFEDQIEATERIPYDEVLPILRDIGAFGLLVPREYGGSGLSITQYLPLIAEFAKIQGGIRVIVHVHNSFAHALAEIANPSQKEEVLATAATGETSLAFALTEPDHGTGADLGTTAIRESEEYVINGRKWLITNSDLASHFLVMAKTAPGQVSAFLVRRATAGLAIAGVPETMGCKGGEHGALTFTDVRVPATALIGAEGQGHDHLERALEISRVFVAAASWGTSQRALDLSVQHSQRRVTFGRPIGQRQAVQRYLAEMAIDVFALRTMLSDAAAKWDAGRRIPAEASMCKQFGLEVVGRVTDRALLVHGGIGYTRRHPIERLYRDARLNWLEEGTPTIQYMVVARELLDGYAFDDTWSHPESSSTTSRRNPTRMEGQTCTQT
jgi:alkylation response protein AidB-like acyl-CoA dehydrogenase